MPRDAPPVVLCLAADDGYAMPLAAALESALASRRPAEPPRPVEVHVLDGGILPWNRARIRRTAARHRHVSLTFHDMAGTVTSRIRHRFYASAAWARLAIPRVVAGRRRALYLDADVVVRADLAPLFDTDLGGRPLGAVVDAWHGHLGRSMQLGPHLPELGAPPAAPYVNTGVLLMDLEAFRRERISEACLELVGDYPLRYADQDAINVVLADRVKLLDPRWNQQHTFHEMPDRWLVETSGLAGSPEALAELRAAPFVVHYTGRKPWHRGPPPRDADRFFEALDRTPWRGWRPTPVGRALRRAERSLAQAVGRVTSRVG